MKISIFGLGYVGFIMGLCLAKSGHDIIGVDINPVKVDLINNGLSPIVEEKADEYMKFVNQNGRFHAVLDSEKAICETHLSFVCVGTPSLDNGNINLEYLERVCSQIGTALSNKNLFHVVVIRSTIVPGTTEDILIPLLEKNSGKKAGEDFGVCYNPEFLREGSSIYDFFNPPKVVISGTDGRSVQLLTEIYGDIEAPIIETSTKCAEMVKYVDNVFHALKIVFSNEIGRLCKKLDIDSHELMDIFTKDTKLNISPAYFKPGFAFGGSCLPKDICAFLYKCKILDIEVPVISSILKSNEQQILMALDLIRKNGAKEIGVLGLSFKPGTDDLRESPIVTLIEMLIGKGYNVKIYDKNVSLAKLVGSNREYIYSVIPHIANLLVDNLDDVFSHAKILVIGHNHPDYKNLKNKLKWHHFVVDLARIWDEYKELRDTYTGICWG